MKRSDTWRRAGAVAACLIAACGHEAEPDDAVATVIGALGVTMTLPAEATIAPSGDGEARVRIAGLPDLVITRRANTTGRVVGGVVGKEGRVTVTRAGREASWSCGADGVPDGLVNRVTALCRSLRPPDAPGVALVRCRDARGRVDEAREAWLGARAEPIVACYAAEAARAPALDAGVFVLAAEHADGARVREQHGFAAPGHAVADAACFDRAAATLEADPGYTPAGGAERFKCTVQLTRY